MRLSVLKKGLILMALPLIFGATIATAAPGKPLSDEWIEGRIQGAMAYNTYLDSADLSVGMDKGVATLSGAVPSDVERELAEAIAMNISGVKSVENEIKVDPELAMRTRPDSVQKIMDATTTAAVKNRLLASKSVHEMDVKITTKNGIVSLSGTVATLPQKNMAEQIAYDTRNVQDVKNELKIADAQTLSEKARNASVSVSRDLSDSWISSKIRTSLLFSSAFPRSNVSVNTNKGKVTLEGYAQNAEQRAAIETAVNDFLGVREVQNNLKLKNS